MARTIGLEIGGWRVCGYCGNEVGGGCGKLEHIFLVTPEANQR